MFALAAVAATGAAFAQSSVTFFGLVDLGIVNTKDSATSSAGAQATAKRTGMESVINGSRWGVKGVEDLGGGLTADFLAEFRMFADETSAGSFNGAGTFGENRQSALGLNGGFGSVRMGRQYTSYHKMQGAFDMVNGNTNSLPGNVMAGVTSRQRASNALQYDTPDFNGFKASLTYAFGEAITTQAQTVKQNDSFGFALTYNQGPLMVGFAQDKVKDINAGTTATGLIRYRGLTSDTTGAFGPQQILGDNGSTATVNNFGASYDLGVAKLSAQIFNGKDTAVAPATTGVSKLNGSYVGVSVPMGAVTLAGSYSQADLKEDGVKEAKGKGYQLLATYALSKRTTAYAAIGQDKFTAVDSVANLKRQQSGVGLRHSF